MTQQFIGRGERTAKTILEQVFPDAAIVIQAPIKLVVSEQVFNLYDEVYQKASIDILMHYKNKFVAIRIQDSKSHIGVISSRKNRIQKEDMEKNNVTVIDIFERESPYLFRNISNYKSYLEVLRPLEKAGVKP